MNALLFLGSLLILAALQAHAPTLWWLGGLRIEFLPPFVAYVALTLKRGWALSLALAAGFTQDALSASPFGLTALAYGIAAMILASMRETFDRDLPWVQMIAGALASVAVSFVACCVVGFGVGAIVKILLLAGINTVVTPMLFFTLDYVRYRTRAA